MKNRKKKIYKAPHIRKNRILSFSHFPFHSFSFPFCLPFSLLYRASNFFFFFFSTPNTILFFSSFLSIFFFTLNWTFPSLLSYIPLWFQPLVFPIPSESSRVDYLPDVGIENRRVKKAGSLSKGVTCS